MTIRSSVEFNNMEFNNTTIQLKHSKAADFTAENPILQKAEMGVETDTNKFKFGDGETRWNNLPYAGGESTGNIILKYGLYTLSANQTSNLSANNHVEFNTIQGSLNNLSTGAGQENGIITLSAGKTYKITGNAAIVSSSSTSSIVFKVYNRTNSTYLGVENVCLPTTYTPNASCQPNFIAMVSPSTPIEIDIRFVLSNNITFIDSTRSYLLIEEYSV